MKVVLTGEMYKHTPGPKDACNIQAEGAPFIIIDGCTLHHDLPTAPYVVIFNWMPSEGKSMHPHRLSNSETFVQPLHL